MKHPQSFLLVAFVLCGCGEGDIATASFGASPQLPDPQRELVPTMKIASPAEWGDLRPTVPDGYSIAPIATELGIPRQMLVLPNGDVLVAEGRGGGAPKLTPKDVIAAYIKAKGTSSVASGNRLTGHECCRTSVVRI